MKRGDAELSSEYSLGIKAAISNCQSSEHDLTNASYLVDIAAEKSDREKMHHTFWEAHKSRQVEAASQAQAGKEELSLFKFADLPTPSTDMLQLCYITS